MIKLVMMIGLPGSGKSYLAQQLQADFPGSLLISTDQIRAQLFGNEAIQGEWLRVWREIERQFRHSITQISQEKASFAIYDATNVARRHRKEAIELARLTGFTYIIGYWVNTPLEVCLQRNKERSRVVPTEVLEKMHRQLTGAPPHLSDGFDEITIISPTVRSEGFSPKIPSTDIALPQQSENRT